MYINKENIRGKNICPLFELIWLTTMLYTVAYIDSWLIDQELGVNIL